MARPTENLLTHVRPGTSEASVTIDNVVVASAGWLGWAVLAALGGWIAAPTVLGSLGPLVLLVGLLGLAFLDYRIYKAPSPPTGLMALSLGGYGFLVGAISWAYAGPVTGGGLGLIGAAATGTLVTAVAVIALYKFRILRAETPKFRAMVLAAGLGYFMICLASLALQVFGGASLFGDGPLGWALCFLGAALAALSLTLAAADIDAAIAHHVPASEASRLGWAFVSTLLWLYLEVLRLLARTRD